MPAWLASVARWIVPYEIVVRLSRSRDDLARADRRKHLEGNAGLRGRSSGRRAFILCNGPSIRQQNLRLLKSELVISVSSGYRHKDFPEFAPAYHCVPQILSPRLTREVKVAWLREMDAGIGKAEVVMSDTERPLVLEEKLFLQRPVHYMALTERFDDMPRDRIIDLARPVPGVQSVPVMALMLAMYLGANPIYLLGTEHDHFRTGRYDYFYEPGLLKGLDAQVAADGTVLNSLYDEFEALHRLWRQYRALRLIAEANGIEIYNATDGGALDEFPRKRFDSLFQ